jgi:hypothetical protein
MWRYNCGISSASLCVEGLCLVLCVEIITPSWFVTDGMPLPRRYSKVPGSIPVIKIEKLGARLNETMFLLNQKYLCTQKESNKQDIVLKELFSPILPMLTRRVVYIFLSEKFRKRNQFQWSVILDFLWFSTGAILSFQTEIGSVSESFPKFKIKIHLSRLSKNNFGDQRNLDLVQNSRPSRNPVSCWNYCNISHEDQCNYCILQLCSE